MLLCSVISSMKSGRCDPFLTGITFISFSFLNTLVTIMSAKSNRNGKNRHPCHVPRLKGNSPYFWPVSIKIVMNFTWKLFIKLVPLLVWVCLMCLLWVLIFLHLCSYRHMMLVFCPLGVLIDFQMLSQTRILEINSILSFLDSAGFEMLVFAGYFFFTIHYLIQYAAILLLYIFSHKRILLLLLLPALRGII